MATWSCDEQRVAVLATLKHETDVCAIMRTGSGKTMIALIPVLVEKAMVTVVVLPLNSLITDYTRKLKKMAIEFEHYTSRHSHITGQHNLILVSADMAKTKNWKQAIAEVHEKTPVARLVFDECHFSFTGDDFRPALRDLYELRSLPIQLCLLSGTIPPRSQAALVQAFGLSSPALIIRMVTDRPELQYIVEGPIQTMPEIIKKTTQLVSRALIQFEEQDRALVFVPYILQGTALSAALGCEFYHGGKGLQDTERIGIYNRWIEGTNRTMVCTNAFGAGNDYSHTRLVVHAGTPKEMVGFIQEVSRAGRDGKSAICQVLPLNPRNRPDNLPAGEIDHKGVQAIWDVLFRSPVQCVRYLLTQFTDGTGVECKNVPDAQKCNRCTTTRIPPKHPSRRPPHHSAFNPSSSSLSTTTAAADAVAAPLAKRKFGNATVSSAFHTQFDDSKKRKTERILGNHAYLVAFENALMIYSGTCAYCYVFGRDTLQHTIVRCPTLQHATDNVNIESYKAWKSLLLYSDKLHCAVCYFCHIPQLDDALHDTFEKEANACHYPDVVAPVGYGIYVNPKGRSNAEAYFKISWPTLDSFVRWLNSAPVAGHKTNLTALFLWYSKRS